MYSVHREHDWYMPSSMPAQSLMQNGPVSMHPGQVVGSVVIVEVCSWEVPVKGSWLVPVVTFLLSSVTVS